MYSIELVACNEREARVIMKLRILLGCNMQEAKQIVECTPCILVQNIDKKTAEKFYTELTAAGATVNMTDEEKGVAAYVPEGIKPVENRCYVNNNDRVALVDLWQKYDERNKIIKHSQEEVQKRKKEISNLEASIKDMKNEIDKNRRIKATNGECLRPEYKRSSIMLSFPDFEIIKWVFVGFSIVTFIIMLIIVAAAPGVIENIAVKAGAPAGLVVWLGAPLIGFIAVVIICVITNIVLIKDSISANKYNKYKHHNFDAKGPLKKAVEFMDNLEDFKNQVKEKEDRIGELHKEINVIEDHAKELPLVQNNVPMPQELRSAEGVALLLYYIDSGRAITVMDAINKYDIDVHNAKEMEELKKQTEYAQEQMINSQIAAENSRVAAENSRIMAENSRLNLEATNRAANAAEEAAYYDRMSYWDNLIKNNK